MLTKEKKKTSFCDNFTLGQLSQWRSKNCFSRLITFLNLFVESTFWQRRCHSVNGRFGNVLLCAKICIIIYPLQEASWQYKRFFLHVSRTWNMTMIHKKYAEFWCLDDIHYSSSDTNFFDKFIIVYHCLSVNSAKLAHIASIFTNIPLPSLFMYLNVIVLESASVRVLSLFNRTSNQSIHGRLHSHYLAFRGLHFKFSFRSFYYL